MLEPQSVFAWIIIGAIAGWLAGLLVKGYGFGLIGNIVIGILGAGIAGLLAPALGLYTQSFGGNIVARCSARSSSCCSSASFDAPSSRPS